MGVIDDDKLQNILPKYSELKLSGKNLAQQYVSAFNTGMNIYQCINQLQGYIEWVIKAVNDVVVQWNEIVDKQINETITASKQATTEQFNTEWEKVQPELKTLSKQATTEQFNIEWEKVQPVLKTLNKIGTDQYYVLTESKDKNVKKLDYYFKYDMDYLPAAPYYSYNFVFRDLDLEGYTVKRSFLSNNTCKLKNKSTGELIDYVYFILDDNVTVTTIKDDPEVVLTNIGLKYLPYFAKLKTDTPVAGHLYVDACISIILEKTSS